MPISAAPRSVSDATRFTAATPHASSKAAVPRFTAPRSGRGSAPGGGGGGSGSGSGGNAGPGIVETPEQRVARLRAAHRRAKEAQVSRFDKVVDAGRRVFDSVHRVTVYGIVLFTGVAVVATAYTAYDMMRYNKKRTSEWVEAQKNLEADSLEAARIAYMTGKATEEQIALVEEQLERERESGRKTSFFSNMSILGAPEPATGASKTATSASASPSSSAAATAAGSEAAAARQRVTEAVSWPTNEKEEASAAEPKKAGLWTWLTSNLKKEEEGDKPMSSQRRLGWESLSEEDDGMGVRDSDMVRAVEQKQAYIREKAHAAFEKEKQNQRQGGPLDRVGIEQQHKPSAEQQKEQEQPKKKGWW
ncbi:Cytochrome oxidase c assembly-domain-containing protein [Madurella fahalii]|uniref:Cytochrome oxidase c assembly-domain-containing protein n=1 Tax=Madurella fahalii TaxID=1157608 RepID=A0ABQ0GEE8_9PEZI